MAVSSSRATFETLHAGTDAEHRRIHAIHLDSLPDDVMPNFGYDVERRYLEALAASGGAIILARMEEEIIGFLLLRFRALEMVRYLSFEGAIRLMGAALRKPRIAFRLLYQVIKARPNPEGSAEIDYFAVDERHRGQGVGEGLVSEAEKQTLQRGLTTVFTKTNNERLCRYYVSQKSAKSVYQFTVLGDVYHGLIWDVREP